MLALCALLVAAFALGGSSQSSVAALIALRPLAALALGFGVWRLKPEHVRRHAALFALAFAAIALTGLQLVPLPPLAWVWLPGHDLIATIDRAAGLSGEWRPLSISPELTRNALFALVVPFAVLVLGAQLKPAERYLLLPLVLAAGATSATIGVVQAASGVDFARPRYGTSTGGEAVGLFTNRNHQALFLAMLLPMLAALSAGCASAAPQRNETAMRLVKLGLPAAAALCLVPLLLVTGSRAGVVLGVVAIAGAGPVLAWSRTGRPARRHGSGRTRWAAWFAIPVVLVIAAASTAGRSDALDRLRDATVADDLRWRAMSDMIALAGHYWPLGSGIGSFVTAYFTNESDRLLGGTFMNHAHNDFLEVVITGGLPGVALLIMASVTYAIALVRLTKAWVNHTPDDVLAGRFATLGLWLILLCALASTVDYPLRTPAIECVFTIAALWADGLRTTRERPLRSVAAPRTV